MYVRPVAIAQDGNNCDGVDEIQPARPMNGPPVDIVHDGNGGDETEAEQMQPARPMNVENEDRGAGIGEGDIETDPIQPADPINDENEVGDVGIGEADPIQSVEPINDENEDPSAGIGSVSLPISQRATNSPLATIINRRVYTSPQTPTTKTPKKHISKRLIQ